MGKWFAALLLLGCLLLSTNLVEANQRKLIPTKPVVVHDFRVPQNNSRSLDESWVYAQTLVDANQFNPELFGAVPVGIATTHAGRTFIATLHTIFRTLDGGRTWTNLDPQLPPVPSPSFNAFRSPNYISDITARPVLRTATQYDSLYVSAFGVANDDGALRLIRGFGTTHFVWEDSLFYAERWVTNVAAPDSQTGIAFSGIDEAIYRNPNMAADQVWDTLEYHFTDTWINEVTTVGDLVIAVGSHQWRSPDRGETWEAFPPADPAGDRDIDFSPSGARGIVSGAFENPPNGWVRYTTDLGETWSARTLTTTTPLTAALMVNDTLGYVAGGLVDEAHGEVWRTTDGGETWSLDLRVDAEITELGLSRESGAYVNVIAAGYYPDFRGGVWRSHVFLPDTIGPVLVAEPDTVRMFATVGSADTEPVTLRNLGDENIIISDVTNSGPFFTDCCAFEILLEPGEQTTVTVTFIPTVDGAFQLPLRVVNDRGQFLEVIAIGETGTAAPESSPLLPAELKLSVYPNPGNAEFRLSYTLAKASDVVLKLFDVSGREIATLVDANRAAGEHVLTWNASAQASGVYFAMLQTGDAQHVTKLVLMK